MALAQLKERLTTTYAVASKLTIFQNRFHWSGSRPLAEWVVEADGIRRIASQLQTSLGAERVSAGTRSDTIKRRDDLQKQQTQLNGRIKRLREAHSAIATVISKHSLEVETQSALQENRKSIEAIFAQIHSPAEFEGIRPSWKLVRKVTREETPIARISTGQRSALALSVFLSQNAQLQAGPPVILIDDPIAHVDDLNALSSLDYLREIMLTGSRQIFFATASNKLASLFERKFEFLGQRFCRFDLTREDDIAGK